MEWKRREESEVNCKKKGRSTRRRKEGRKEGKRSSKEGKGREGKRIGVK